MGAKKDLRTLFFRFVLVAIYCVTGAGIFYAIEYNDNYESEIKRKQLLFNTTKTLLKRMFGVNETEFKSFVMKVIDARSDTPLKWTFATGVDLCWQTMTTIGYGNKPPTTLGGQLFLIPFAIFGIPLNVFMLNTVGQNICHLMSFIIRKIERNLCGKKKVTHCKVKLLFSVFLLTIFLIVFMAAVSTKAEDWSFGQGLYIWFVTFSTIGFGDYIPGDGTDFTDRHLAIVYRLVFITIGLSLVSTLFNAMADCIEEKRKKAEASSWIGFLVGPFTCYSQNTEDKLDNDITGMGSHPRNANCSQKQGAV